MESNAYKIILLGESGVGKTALTLRFHCNEFHVEHKATIGVEFITKGIPVQLSNGVVRDVKLQVWDTAGQERFKAITRTYYSGAQGVILVFSLGNLDSFLRVAQDWVSILEQESIKSALLIGNMADLPDHVVKQRDIDNFCAGRKLRYIQTSALTGQNVNEAFETMAKELLEATVAGRMISDEGKGAFKLHQPPPPTPTTERKQKGGCCGGTG